MPFRQSARLQQPGTRVGWSSRGCESAIAVRRGVRRQWQVRHAVDWLARAAHFPRRDGLQSFAQRRISPSSRLSASAADAKRSFASPLCAPRFFKLVPPWAISVSSRSASCSRLPGSLRLGQCGCVRCLPVSTDCMAWRRLASSFPFRGKNFFGRSARFLLARLHLLAKGAASSAAVSEMTSAGVRSRQFPLNCARVSCPTRRRPWQCASPARHALSIGAFPRRGPLQLDSRGVARDSAPPGPRHPTGSPAR